MLAKRQEVVCHLLAFLLGLMLLGAERGRGSDHGNTPGGSNVKIDGVSKATASVRIVNQRLLSAALVVARAKLGFAAGRSPDQVGHIETEIFKPMDLDALRRAELASIKRWRQRDIEAAFKGTAGEGLASRHCASPMPCSARCWSRT
jgi:transcriptional regulator of nitric oxide reductase